MNYPEKPVKGFKIERVCIKCDSKAMMEIAKFKKKSVNADGSSCYTIQATCPNVTMSMESGSLCGGTFMN